MTLAEMVNEMFEALRAAGVEIVHDEAAQWRGGPDANAYMIINPNSDSDQATAVRRIIGAARRIAFNTNDKMTVTMLYQQYRKLNGK